MYVHQIILLWFIISKISYNIQKVLCLQLQKCIFYINIKKKKKFTILIIKGSKDIYLNFRE